MGWRVARLEEDSRELRGDVRALHHSLASFRTDVLERITSSREEVLTRISSVEKDVLSKISSVEKEVSELKGRVSQLPSTWVMLTGMLAIMSGLAGLVYAITRASGRG